MATKGMYGFIVDYYDEDEMRNYGMVNAETYEEAMHKVFNYFGEENINSIKIEFKDEGELVFLKSDIYNEYMDTNCFPSADYAIKLSAR